MKHALLALLSFTSWCSAAGSGEPLAEPKTLLKILTAIESSGIEYLTSRSTEDGTYHMKTLTFLGTVTRSGQTYSIAHAAFVRSSPPGSETPPARGHGFIVVVDSGFKIIGVGRTNLGYSHMTGDKLYEEGRKEPVADFGSTSAIVRHAGYPEIGLEYPFPDRISEEAWQSGSFLKDLSEEDKKSGYFPVPKPE